MAGDEATQRVETAMDEARQDLGIKWTDVARRAGISPKTLERFRGGQRTADTTRKIELVFGWPRGYIEALVNDEPLPKLEAQPERDERNERAELLHEMDAKLAEARDILRRLDELGHKRDVG